MKLIRLTLQNFKGIKDFSFIPNGQNASIYADNGKGKTTIVDASRWLKFGKDSNDRADFNIKTLDENGEEIHGLEHQVEEEIDLDGIRVVLKKVYKEKWTKKKGQIEPELTGHKTEHFIDDVPKDKREFEDYINSIIPEKIFKLVTNPLYFNSSLHWKERREIMLSICGDIGNDQVFEANKALEHVRQLLDNKTTEDALKMLKAQKAKINKELDETPIRISEVSNSTPELPQNVDFSKINLELSELQEKIIVAEKNKSNLLKDVNDEKKVFYDKIAEAQKELLLIRSDKSKLELDAKSFEQRKKDLTSLVEIKKASINRNLANIKQFESDLEVLARQRESLIKLWHEADKQTFMLADGNTTCKACGQSLPESLRSQKIGKLEEAFKKQKDEELASIESKGKMLKTQVESYNKSIENCKENNIVLENELTELVIPSSSFESDGMSVLDEAIVKIEASIAGYRKELEGINYEEQLGLLDLDIAELRLCVSGLEKTLSLKEVYQKNQLRIDELKTKQQELSKAFLLLEKQVDGVERFIKCKCDMQEGTLNSMFDGVKFKLFETQINSGINECFETLVLGVPWVDANGAAKVNSGIEIINKLCEHYEFTAPIFVDNSESVVKLQPSNSQIIRLVVDGRFKKLTTVDGLVNSPPIPTLDFGQEEFEKATDEEFDNLITLVKGSISDRSGGYIDCDLGQFDDKVEEIGTEIGDQGRWYIRKTTTYRYKDRYFALSWNDPATEMQEGQDTSCEVFVVRPVQELVTKYI